MRGERRVLWGPRLEMETNGFCLQPRPYAAIDLIHKQPVRWTHDRMVACDGGGGPLGHPRIFINVDKPQICWCTYCGVPYVSEALFLHWLRLFGCIVCLMKMHLLTPFC